MQGQISYSITNHVPEQIIIYISTKVCDQVKSPGARTNFIFNNGSCATTDIKGVCDVLHL